MNRTNKSQELAKKADNYLQSEDFSKLLPYLLSGGGGALLGGLMTGSRKADDGESRLGYLGRVLRNALVTGGLAGGAHYLLGKGIDKTIAPSHTASQPGNQGPLESAARNVAFSPITAAAAGVGGLAATHGNSFLGAGNTEDAMKRFMAETGRSKAFLSTATPHEISALGGDERIRRLAGLASSRIEPGGRGIGNLLEMIPGMSGGAGGGGPTRAESAKGALSSLHRRTLGTLGQTTGRRIGRGALGLAAAGIPALLGAMFTDEDMPHAQS